MRLAWIFPGEAHGSSDLIDRSMYVEDVYMEMGIVFCYVVHWGIGFALWEELECEESRK